MYICTLYELYKRKGHPIHVCKDIGNDCVGCRMHKYLMFLEPSVLVIGFWKLLYLELSEYSQGFGSRSQHQSTWCIVQSAQFFSLGQLAGHPFLIWWYEFCSHLHYRRVLSMTVDNFWKFNASQSHLAVIFRTYVILTHRSLQLSKSNSPYSPWKYISIQYQYRIIQ